MFDIFWKRKPSDYDIVYKWYEEKRDELEQVRKYLAPFEDAFARNPIRVLIGQEATSTVQLARNVHALLESDTKIIQQQAREIEQLTEQLDQQREILAENERVRRVIAKVQEENKQLQQQQIMLTTTTPTNKPKGKRVKHAMPGTYEVDV